MSLVKGPHTAEVGLLMPLVERVLVRHHRRLLKREFHRRMASIRRKSKALEALRAADLKRRFGVG